jgi:hypothetical protein
VNTARCARPACSGNPAAWLAYDYEARCAWLDDDPAHTTDPAQHWPLCERHADALKVPRGWFCVDRRAGRVSSDGRPGGTAGAAPGQGGQLSAIL